MANWVKALLEQHPDIAALPVVKRSRRSIHFERPDGTREAHFTGAPCHYQDTDGIWKPLDTQLVAAPGGFYGAPGTDVLIHPDGRVQVSGSKYEQFTRLTGNPIGKVDGDRIVREFPEGVQYLYLLENGFREIIILDREPPSPSDFLASKTGTLPNKYFHRPQVIRLLNQADFNRFIFSNLETLSAILKNSIYPIEIDPDFSGSTDDDYVYGNDSTYSTARSTSAANGGSTTTLELGLRMSSKNHVVSRAFLKFDTSSIPDTDVISQVNLKMVCTSDQSATDVDIQIVKQNWSSQDPIGSANREAAYDNCLSGTADSSIWRNTSGMSENTQYTSGNLSTSWINKTGNTYYSLRNSADVAASDNGGDAIYLASASHATSDYRPVLVVAYAPATLTATTQAYTLTGNDAGLFRGLHLDTETRTYILTGVGVTLTKSGGLTLAADVQTYTFSGNDAGLLWKRVLPATTQTYTLTGMAANLLRGRYLDATVCTFTFTGNASGLLRGMHLDAGAGTFTLTGVAAGLLWKRVLPATTQTYTLTGKDVTLTLTTPLKLAAGVSAFTMSGIAAGLLWGRHLDAAAQSYILTGMAAALERSGASSLPVLISLIMDDEDF